MYYTYIVCADNCTGRYPRNFVMEKKNVCLDLNIWNSDFLSEGIFTSSVCWAITNEMKIMIKIQKFKKKMGGLPLGLKSQFFAETCSKLFFATSQHFEKITNKSETEFCVDCTKKEVFCITVRGENACESYMFFKFFNKSKTTKTFLKYNF